MIKLIATDLDGTLLSGYDTISEENIVAIRAEMAKGVHFTVASGRSAYSCARLLRMHGLEEAHIIAVNGAHTMDRPFGKTLSLHVMEPALAAECIRIFESYDLHSCLYAADMVVYGTQESMAYFEYKPAKIAVKDAETAPEPIRYGPDAMRAALAASPLKAFCAYRKGQQAAFEAARAACARLDGASLTSSWMDNFEVMPTGVDKGAALCALAAQLGIDREEVMAFGDHDNDLSMLTWAGVGVAMGNARESIKHAVRHVTKTCNESGVAHGIALWAR